MWLKNAHCQRLSQRAAAAALISPRWVTHFVYLSCSTHLILLQEDVLVPPHLMHWCIIMIIVLWYGLMGNWPWETGWAEARSQRAFRYPWLKPWVTLKFQEPREVILVSPLVDNLEDAYDFPRLENTILAVCHFLCLGSGHNRYFEAKPLGVWRNDLHDCATMRIDAKIRGKE